MKINYSKQFIDRNDINFVTQSLKAEMITQGSYINKFETALKSYFKAKYCSAVSNGTAALYLACRSLGWGKNDTIITSPITFVATANAIEAVGAKTELVDIEENTYCLDLNKLEYKIKKLKKQKKKIKGIIAIDYAGQPSRWKEINFLRKKYKLQIINDNCHALGASYNGSKGYAVKYADIVCQSYHPVKNFTTGEGGSVLSNNKIIIDKINKLRSHGIERNKKNLIIKKNFSNWYYEAQDLSFNFRISDINCALGISQLKKLDSFVKFRKKIAKIYNKELTNLECVFTPKNITNSSHSYHLYPIRIDFKKLNINKRKLFNYFLKKNYKLQVHYIPIYMHPYYKKKYNYKLKDFPVSNKFYEQIVSIPNFFGFSKSKQYEFIELFKNYVSK